MKSSQWNVSKLIIGADKFNLEITPTHLFMNKMVFNFDVLSASMANAKTLWHQRIGLWRKKKTPNPWKSMCSQQTSVTMEAKILYFPLVEGCKIVGCGTPGNWVMAKINKVACNRFSILRVTCLLCIVVGKQWKRAYNEMKVMVLWRYYKIFTATELKTTICA